MTSYTFGSQHETGNKLLDQEHQQLYQFISVCVLLTRNGTTCEYLVVKLNELYERLENHFANEEKMMNSFDVSQVKTHKSQHGSLLAELKNKIRNFVENGTRIKAAETILVDLLDWYETHIEYEDKKLATHLVDGAATKKSKLKEAA